MSPVSISILFSKLYSFCYIYIVKPLCPTITCPRNNLLCVGWDVKPYLAYHLQLHFTKIYSA